MERISILGTPLAYEWLDDIVKLYQEGGKHAQLCCRKCGLPGLEYRFQRTTRSSIFGETEENRLWLWCPRCSVFGLVAGLKVPDWYHEPNKGEGWWDSYKEDIAREHPDYAASL